MRLAWFRPDPEGQPPSHLDGVVTALAHQHTVTVVTEARAHDFVWQHARGHFDLVVYELDNTARHVYMWPYLLNYPGLLALQSASLHDSRRARLVHEGRQTDYQAEIAFAGGPTHTAPPWHLAKGRWPMVRVPVEASCLTVIADELLAETLAAQVGESRVRYVMVGVEASRVPVSPQAPIEVTVAEQPQRHAAVERAVSRLRAEGTPIAIAQGAETEHAAITVATRWPGDGRPLVAAIRAFASARAVVVADSHASAAWPTLDPQTWQVRGFGALSGRQPVGVSIDPRDEEHSLVLALRRLATDGELRHALGRAGQAWWQHNATVERAVVRWNDVLHAAKGCASPARPAGWPAHLDQNGSTLGRALLGACGVDFPWR